MQPRWAFILIVPLIALLLSACSTSGDDQDDEPTAEELIEQAQETFADMETARFALEIDGAIEVDESGMLAITSVEGEVARPANARVDAGVRFAGSSVTMELVAAEGEMYLRNVLTGDWERAPTDLQFDPSGILDTDAGISAVFDQLQELELAGEDTVDGVDAWHLTGNIDASSLEGLTGPFFESDELDVDLWLARDDQRLLRVILDDPEAEEGGTWQLDLFDHNEDIEITAPDIDS